MSKYDVSSIETSGFDNESSYGEYSNNYDYNIESIDIDDPEVTHVEFDKPQTKSIEIPDGIDQETTYYTKEEGIIEGNILIESIGNFFKNPKQFLVSSLATIGNVGVAVTSGIGKVAEGLYDSLHIAGGVVATPVTGIFDLIGSLTGGDTKATERMWNSTRNVVQKQIVNDSLDSYYSVYGKNLNENAAIGFKRGEVGFSVIQTGGEVLGTLATGQALTGSSVLSSSGTNAAVYVSGIKGFGLGTEEAWNNGASTFGGITYGAGTGMFEAAQWYGGAKVNSIKIGKGVTGKYATIATHVLLDGIDGSVDAPVRSFFDTAYNGKSYIENFNERGGVQAILQGFFMGAGFSAISEFIQLKMEKSSNISQIDDINYKSKDNYSGEVKNVNDDVIADKGNYKIGPNDIYSENMIENFVKSMDDGNGSGLEALRKISENGGFDFIPDDNIYKQAIQDIPMEKIKTYINSVDARYMNNAICFSSVSDLPDISDRFWTSFDNRGEVRILVNGELLSIDNAISLKMKYDSSLKGKVESFIKRVKENIELNDKLEQFENAKRFNSDTEIALFFNDKNQYMFEQLKKLHELYPNDPYISYLFDGYSDLPNYMKNADDIYNNIQSLYAIDSSYEPIIKQFNSDSISGLSQMYTKKDYSSIFSDTMKEEGYIYSRVSGPLLVAYERGVDTKFIPSGTDRVSYNPGSSKVQTQYYYDQIRPQLSTNIDKDIYSQVVGVYGDNTNFLKGTKDIDIAIKQIDDMIKLAPELSENVILYRGTNSLFFNGESISSGKLDISNLKVGQIINDKATVSTSLMFDKCYKSNEIILEILAPKGTKGVYLESMVNGYGQQEFLLGRNTNFRIVSEPVMIDVTYELNGQIIKEKRPKIRVEIVSDEVAKEFELKNSINRINNATPKLPESNATPKLPESNATPKLPEINIKKVNIVEDLGLETSKVGDSALKYNQIFNKNTTGVSVDEMVEKLKNNGLLKEYNEKIGDIDILYSKGEGPYVIHHDVSHVERIMLYSLYMGEELGLNSNEMNILIDAAKYHDVGVYAGHDGHSLISAQTALENLSGSYSKENLNKIAAIIEYHELNDGMENFNSVIKKYNISSSDAIEVMKIANVLKDADAIDRTRFMRNLDTRYFRNSELANELVMASYQMQELQAKQLLDEKINNGIYDNKKIRDITSYRKKGIPDYVIYESYENYYRWGYVSAEDMIDIWMGG